MKKSSELLNLENKLDKFDDKQRVLNKFLLKPNMKLDGTQKSSLLKTLPDFINNFKKNNQELLSDPKMVEKANIENKKTNSSNDKLIKMNLGLGVLEVKDKKEESEIKIRLPEKVMENPFMDEKEEELLNFIAKNWANGKSKRRRRIKLKNKRF